MVVSLVASAQPYPHKPVRMIIPFAPGGASDFVGRILQPHLGERLGQQVVIENRAGAAGNIGMEAAARAAPDGYTIYLGNIGTVAINPAVFPKMPVNPLKDFIPVTLVVDVPSTLVVNPSFAVNTVKEFVANAKGRPGQINYASPGSGSQNRLEMELLRGIEGLQMVHVPYKGGAGPAVTGLVAGETTVMFTTLPSAIGMVRGNRLRALAVTSAKRLDQLPAVPTMMESGYPEFATSSWQGIFVPTGTPRDIVDRLYAAVIQTMKLADVGERLAKGGVSVWTSASSAEFADFVAAETRRWEKVAKDSGATVD
jgi:tripartite-type tricarboxylate transporter receptor subunit TctC